MKKRVKLIAAGEAGAGNQAAVVSELRELQMADIDEPSLPSRETMDSEDMQELMESIAAIGLISPIAVVRKGARFEVAAGHRRLLAHKYLHRETIRAFVYPEGYEFSDAVMLHENIVREQLNPAEEAIFIVQLIEKHHYDEETLMRVLKRSAVYIGERVQLLRGDPVIFELVRARRIGFSVARILNRFTDEQIRHFYAEHAARNAATARVVEDWYKQWIGNVQPAIEATKQQQADAEPLPPAEDTMVCFFCGGGRDKYNLRAIYVHYWELEHLRKGLEAHAEAMMQGGAEPNGQKGVQSHG